MQKPPHTPIKFLWQIIKPYKRLYFVMIMVAPFASGVYPIMYNYAVKLLIDLFTQNERITFTQGYKPILWFVGAQVVLDGAWRAHNFAQLKAMPYVLQNMLDRVLKHCFHLPYAYYQNHLAGSIVGKIRGIGDNYFKMHQALENQLSKPLLTTLFSGIALAYTNTQIFMFIVTFATIYSPLATYFFVKLAKMEQEKQNSWYSLFGTVADCVTNIFTIFSFASKKREIERVDQYYVNVHNPLVVQYYRYDIIISIILSLIYWLFMISIFIFIIHLRNNGEISMGDIAFVMSLTFLFMDNSWHTTMEIKDFLKDIAAFKAAFTIMQVPVDATDKRDAREQMIV